MRTSVCGEAFCSSFTHYGFSLVRVNTGFVKRMCARSLKHVRITIKPKNIVSRARSSAQLNLHASKAPSFHFWFCVLAGRGSRPETHTLPVAPERRIAPEGPPTQTRHVTRLGQTTLARPRPHTTTLRPHSPEMCNHQDGRRARTHLRPLTRGSPCDASRKERAPATSAARQTVAGAHSYGHGQCTYGRAPFAFSSSAPRHAWSSTCSSFLLDSSLSSSSLSSSSPTSLASMAGTPRPPAPKSGAEGRRHQRASLA